MRKALVQVHLWVGIAVGLYILVISISGSALVFRRELVRMYSRKAIVIAESSRRMSMEELQQKAQRLYPGYSVYSVNEIQRPDRTDEIVLGNGKERIGRLFDPYTGADLGDPHSGVDRAFGWLVDLHDNLLSGLTGRLMNGTGAFFIVLLSLTGILIWWPGIKNWRRSVTINRKANFA
ncbi:MAG: PepSY-associated TM helix domain-containing protein, partial [Bryobacteraceae bacterium]